MKTDQQPQGGNATSWSPPKQRGQGTGESGLSPEQPGLPCASLHVMWAVSPPDPRPPFSHL